MMRTLVIYAAILFWGLNSSAYFEQQPSSSTHDQDVAQAQKAIDSYRKSLRKMMGPLDGEAPYSEQGNQMRKAEGRVAQGYWINVDTRDQQACKEVYESIRSLKSNEGQKSLHEFCKYDPAQPMLSVLVLQDINATEFRKELDISSFKTTDQNIVTDTRNMALTMVGAMGLFWMLPESTTQWDKKAISESKHGIFTEYFNNVKKGPVMDGDNWYFNWIGHPVSGAAYYTLARHNNMTMMQSFGYSVVMSTFFWEYGFEAFAEVPSIQDLFITPIIGSLLGELMYRAELSIVANQGKLMGSKALGKLALVILNPMGALSSSINKALGSQVIQSAKADWVVRNEQHEHQQGVSSTYVGVQLRFVFY